MFKLSNLYSRILNPNNNWIIMIIREKALIIIEYESAAEKILLPLASDLNILEITKKITKLFLH